VTEKPDGYPPEFVKFLGTAGARFVVSKQLRASGGLWVRLAGQTLAIDPGPGALVKAHTSRPKLDPAKLDAILVSHKHLDHTNDVNALVEAMTEGGHRPRGVLLGPADAIDGDSPICQYVLRYAGEVVRIAEGGAYQLGDLRIRVAARHDHPDETYGFTFEGGAERVGLLVDARYHDWLAPAYADAELLIVHMVLLENPDFRIYHLAVADAEAIIAAARPRRAVLTHFGMRVLQAKPWGIARAMSDRLGIEVIAATDGLTVAVGRPAADGE
jgi:ribonuclease BN (tRNA processing enzyme)